jgi:hypothetical protein
LPTDALLQRVISEQFIYGLYKGFLTNSEAFDLRLKSVYVFLSQYPSLRILLWVFSNSLT